MGFGTNVHHKNKVQKKRLNNKCASPQSILYQIKNQKRSNIILEDLLDQYSKE